MTDDITLVEAERFIDRLLSFKVYTESDSSGECITMIQHRRFHDGSFVLHRVMLNGHKYSAWYSPGGELTSAELFMCDGNTRNVTKSQIHVRAQLLAIGKPYVGVQP